MEITVELLERKYGFNPMGNMAVFSMPDGAMHWSGGFLTICVYKGSTMSVLQGVGKMNQIDPIMRQLGFTGKAAKKSKIIVPPKIQA